MFVQDCPIQDNAIAPSYQLSSLNLFTYKSDGSISGNIIIYIFGIGSNETPSVRSFSITQKPLRWSFRIEIERTFGMFPSVGDPERKYFCHKRSFKFLKKKDLNNKHPPAFCQQRYKQTNKHIDRQTDNPTDKHLDREIDRQTEE